ncbi:GntR family transcriptional regulator [Bacillus sonorensis]|uniref:GntR family transcriptional regulator n=2 Tax=Bacillus sonorensis TaxID=119858 RepID=M5PDL7_9BACI|nr:MULTISPECIES: GntR family transcriptional regulator [Bacillus]TWK83671.1 HTH-type transcriptional repressor YvoA [Bacillus paralicheniformis]ASB91529.1 HTH-type transcriptional repressor YvoA [Bacillus sonorensis]EME73892.1 GntR family transcriptional regulator [Bacillus sonorensis L12]MBG9914824.1 GntR family transcriptional regulator [Bacillus sonorensis]MCF7615869.1 GntR family transcriptional regulator [Bacillus sonorensis]
MIKKDSHIPIYYQIETEIKKLAETNDLKPGDLIPSEREFAEKYEVSRMTVRQAVNNLVNEGILVRQRGKGTFIAKPKIEQTLQGLTSFSEDMKSRGMTPGTKMLGFRTIPCDQRTASKLEIPEGSSVYEVKRIRLADEIPMAYEISYLPVDLINGLTEDIMNASLYDYVENTLSLTIDQATQTLEPSIAQQAESVPLDIEEGAPVLLIERCSYLTDGRPFELVKSVYRGDRYKFVIDMKRKER